MNKSESIVSSLTVRDLMNREVLAAKADWSLDQLSEFFTDNDISGAPVTSEDGELIGVVSVTDIIRHNSLHVHEAQSDPHDYYLKGLESQYAREEIAALRIEAEITATVGEIMTPMIFQVTEDTSVRDAADTMIKGHIHRVFVTQERRVVGVVTALDMLKVIRDM